MGVFGFTASIASCGLICVNGRVFGLRFSFLIIFGPWVSGMSGSTLHSYPFFTQPIAKPSKMNSHSYLIYKATYEYECLNTFVCLYIK